MWDEITYPFPNYFSGATNWFVRKIYATHKKYIRKYPGVSFVEIWKGVTLAFLIHQGQVLYIHGSDIKQG